MLGPKIMQPNQQTWQEYWNYQENIFLHRPVGSALKGEWYNKGVWCPSREGANPKDQVQGLTKSWCVIRAGYKWLTFKCSNRAAITGRCGDRECPIGGTYMLGDSKTDLINRYSQWCL